MTTSTLTTDMDALKQTLQQIWTAGDYDRFSRYLEGGAREFYDRLPVAPGAMLLDVGCGSGQLALIAAKDGLEVTGVDIAPNWVERARARAQAEGLRVRFDQGDAEALPYADKSFDLVVSILGAMFAPRPDLVAQELLRVCVPGARWRWRIGRPRVSLGGCSRSLRSSSHLPGCRRRCCGGGSHGPRTTRGRSLLVAHGEASLPTRLSVSAG